MTKILFVLYGCHGESYPISCVSDGRNNLLPLSALLPKYTGFCPPVLAGTVPRWKPLLPRGNHKVTNPHGSNPLDINFRIGHQMDKILMGGYLTQQPIIDTPTFQ